MRTVAKANYYFKKRNIYKEKTDVCHFLFVSAFEKTDLVSNECLKFQMTIEKLGKPSLSLWWLDGWIDECLSFFFF